MNLTRELIPIVHHKPEISETKSVLLQKPSHFHVKEKSFMISSKLTTLIPKGSKYTGYLSMDGTVGPSYS